MEGKQLKIVSRFLMAAPPPFLDARVQRMNILPPDGFRKDLYEFQRPG